MSRPPARPTAALVPVPVLVSALVLAGAVAAAGQEALLERVIELGDPAPGFPAGATVAVVGDAPRIDAAGTVALAVRVEDAEGLSSQALYRVPAAGEPALVFRSGDPAPGSGGRFTLFPALPATPRIDHGRLVFAASTDLPGAGSAGVWTDRAGAFAPLALTGDRLPAMPATAGLVTFSLAARGHEAWLTGDFSDGGPHQRRNRGLWRNRSGAWEPLAVGGAPAPGLGDGVVFDADPAQAFGPVFGWDAAPAGPAAFQAWVSGPGIDDDEDEALWLAPAGGAPAILVREGARLPGPGRPAFGPSAGSPVFGGAGENVPVVVAPSGAVLFGAVVTSSRGRLNTVWTTRTGAPRLELRGGPPLDGFDDGDPAPGLAPGATFAAFEAGALDGAGVLALQATAAESGDPQALTRGVWWDRGGTLSLVAATGRPAPGLAGPTLADLTLERLTEGGAVLFSARLSGLGVDAANDRALFLAVAGGAGPVLREGDAVQVATPSGPRTETVAAFRLGGGLSDDGRAAIEVAFAGGAAGVYRLALPAPPGCVPDEQPETSCDNGEDDDCDGQVDGADPDCAPSCLPAGASCTEPAQCCSGRCRGGHGNRTCR